jgi:hypothetical protein
MSNRMMRREMSPDPELVVVLEALVAARRRTALGIGVIPAGWA